MITGEGTASRVAALLRAGRRDDAARLVADAAGALLGEPVATVAFTTDAYSLNSVSARLRTAAGAERFVKFHTEDGETEGVGEYYRAGLLAAAGLPVEVPLAVAGRPGEQLVAYTVRTEPRLVDVCLDLESAEADPRLPAPLERAVHELHRRIGEVLVATLRPPTPAAAAEGIHQLFVHRLTGPDGAFPGGRYAAWYAGDERWEAVADLPWTVDGVRYALTPRQAVERAATLLDPRRLAAGPVVTAHGDDHHGNVWVLGPDDAPHLSLFDPAFAGEAVPALLAPVKATYHNVFAHPFWLYHPQRAAAQVAVGPDGVHVTTGRPRLSPLRRQVLAGLDGHVWRPLLAAARPWLPADARDVVRAALLACPLLVTDLLAPDRPDPVRYLGIARALQAGSEPVDGADEVSRWLDGILP